MTRPADSSRAVQRTVLAWQRTGLGLVGLGALLLHGGSGRAGPSRLVLGVGVAVAGAGLAGVGAPWRRRHVDAALLGGRSPAVPLATGLLAAFVVAVAVAAAALLS